MLQRKCMLIALDGLRGDVCWELIQHKQCPHMSSLWGQIAKTHSGAKTGRGFQWCTAPGWASVFLGLDNKVHGIKNNTATQVRKFWSCRWTTVFDHAASSAVLAKPYVYSAGQLGVTSLLDTHKFTEAMAVHYEQADGDRRLLQRASQLMTSRVVPDLVFVHLDVTDQAGHQHGFGFNGHYKRAIRIADSYVGQLLDLVDQRNDLEDWLVMVLSDHGGHGKKHTTNELTDNQVPFMCNLEPLDMPLARPLCHMDVGPTVLRWLQTDVPGHMRHKGLTF